MAEWRGGLVGNVWWEWWGSVGKWRGGVMRWCNGWVVSVMVG